eukprot:6013917-Pleurochrysis_carterae.AAC.1
MEEGDYMASAMAMWTTPFMPNLLNTCVFLVETAQCIAVLLVNYKGPSPSPSPSPNPNLNPQCMPVLFVKYKLSGCARIRNRAALGAKGLRQEGVAVRLVCAVSGARAGALAWYGNGVGWSRRRRLDRAGLVTIRVCRYASS